ncbi:MAG: ribonuclease D [Myxococcota bacterium]
MAHEQNPQDTQNPQELPKVELRAPEFTTPVKLVSHALALTEAVAHLESLSQVAIDLESDSLYHYYDKVCLIQISGGGVDYIVDPLALKDLSPLAEILADRRIEKIFHAADNDVALLHRCLGLETFQLFDTLVAAQLCGHRQFGLSFLLGHYFGLLLDKRLQRYDWSSRPLLPEHLAYARSDTHFLAELRSRLLEQVVALGREDILQEELLLLEQKRNSGRQFVAEDALKLQGAMALDMTGQRVLLELYQVRERLAKQDDLPPFRLITNEMLVGMAGQPVRGLRELYGLPSLAPRVIKKYGTELLGAFQRGRASTSPLPVPPPPRPRPVHAAEIEARFQMLKRWRQKVAEVENLELAVVASNQMLMIVATANPASMGELEALPHLRRWQVRRFGPAWLETLKKTNRGQGG